MRFLSAFAAFLAICTAASAQLLSVSQPLQQRSLPYGVSIPAVTSSSVSYPGCPGEVTSHTNTWYFDITAGATQSGGGTGTIAHPWKDLQALTGNNAGTPMAGYTQVLLSTAPGGSGGPVLPGDLIILNTGSYGALQLGGSTAIVNSPAITIVAGAGQTPLFTTIAISEFTGLHLEGVKVRSINPGSGVGLLVATDNGVPHSTGDIIAENNDISSTDVATGDGLSKATWISEMRPGVVFQSNGGDNIPSLAWSCASLVNSHVYEASDNGLFGAVEGQVSSLFVQGNEIDHFYPIGVDYQMSNTAIGHNYFHDFVQTSQGSQLYAIYNFIDASLDHTKNQSNIYVYNNKHIESVDPSQTLGQAQSSFFLNSTGDITNLIVWDNLVAASNECGVCPGNSHNYVVANNSVMHTSGGQSPEIEMAQAHAGAAGYGTGPVGNPPSNGWVYNNSGPIYNNANSNVIQTYHNIAAPDGSGFTAWNYTDQNWQVVDLGATAGTVITLPAGSGQQNLMDGGVGGGAPQANEFTTVACTTTAFPCSPQPNWTPLPGSPAATAGGVQSPLLADYNGVPFSAPYSIGALAAFAGYDTTAAIDCEFKLGQCWDGTAGTLVAPSTLLTDTRAATEPYDPGNAITSTVAANTLPIGSAGLQVFQNNVNYLKSTNGDYSGTGSWTPAHSGAVAPTVTKNPNFGTTGCTTADTAPDGSCNTTELTFPAMAANQESVVQQQSATLTVGATYTWWAWCKNSAATSNPQTYIDVLEGASPFSEIAQQIIQPGPTWQRFAVTFVMPVGFTTVYPEIGGTTPTALGSNQGQVGGGTLECWVSGLTLGSSPGPYVPTTTTAATTIALDNIAATGHLATALASSNAAVAVTTQMGGNGLAGTMLDANGLVLLGKNASDNVTTGIGANCTGGTQTISGSNTIFTFTSSGTLTCASGFSGAHILVVGGGGGASDAGGGAGGYCTTEGTPTCSLGATVTIPSGATTVTVGLGGAGSGTPFSSAGTIGQSSSLGAIVTALGGGPGGANNANAPTGSLGSGGGAGGASLTTWTGGVGTQGNNGSNSCVGSSQFPGGGGGGAGAAGTACTSDTAPGNGGNGLANSISGLSVSYAGGGGAGVSGSGSFFGTGGTGGGGSTHSAGTAGTGGGGGGGNFSFPGGAGGSGIVVVSCLSSVCGGVLSSKAQGNFSAPETGYLAWNASGGKINLDGTTVVSDTTARTPAATFHVGTTSGTTAPLNGYVTSLKVYSTAVTPPLVASAPLTGVSMTAPITLASGTLQSGAPSTYVEGDTWMCSEDASTNVFCLSNDSGWGSFSASGGNGNVMLSEPSWTAGTPGYYNFANITAGPPGVVNSFSTALGTFATQQTSTANTWKSCGLIAIKDGTNTDLFAGLVWQQNPSAAPWNFGQASSTIVSATTANAATSSLWNGMPPTPPVLPVATSTFNSVNFGAPCFVQYANGYVNSTLPTPNPDLSGTYLYAISNDSARSISGPISISHASLWPRSRHR